jgi:hypothetical protein
MLDPTVCPDEQTAVRYFLNRSMAGLGRLDREDDPRASRESDVVESPARRSRSASTAR